MNEPVTIIIPTYNNQQFLQPCLVSLYTNVATKNLYRVIVVNNGHPDSCNWINDNELISVVNTGENLGWEGGLKEGLKHTDSPFVIFMNDDTLVPTFGRMWVNRLIQHFKDPQIGAVGPSSNVVMGRQNIFYESVQPILETTYLIGFCMMLRRSTLEEVGGVDYSLPGGDDLDISIRLRSAGYKLIADRDTFIYHHGFKTGTRVRGDHTQGGGWNSMEMTEQTNFALIKKHGFKKWVDCLYGSVTPYISQKYAKDDIEGDLIRSFIQGSVVLDLGCGHNKTTDTAIGVDMVAKNEEIATLKDNPTSVADVQADVSQPLPFPEGYADTVIARHILEHLHNPMKIIRQWKQVIKSGGRLIIAVPDDEKFLSIPMNIEHKFGFTKDTITDIVEACGFDVEEQIESGNDISFITVCKARWKTQRDMSLKYSPMSGSKRIT